VNGLGPAPCGRGLDCRFNFFSFFLIGSAEGRSSAPGVTEWVGLDVMLGCGLPWLLDTEGVLGGLLGSTELVLGLLSVSCWDASDIALSLFDGNLKLACLCEKIFSTINDWHGPTLKR
jgi:hypothetical protein